MAVDAPCRDQLKSPKHVERSVNVTSLLGMVTVKLADLSQHVYFHSPFPTQYLRFLLVNVYEIILANKLIELNST